MASASFKSPFHQPDVTVSCLPAPVHLAVAGSGARAPEPSGLPRVVQGILARASVPALFPDC
jgi:hypothetical protein